MSCPCPPPPPIPKSPLGDLAASSGLPGSQGVSERNQLSKSGVSAPRETRGKECASACEESALGFPWQGVRDTATLLPSSPQPRALPASPSWLRGRRKDAQLRAGKRSRPSSLPPLSARILPASAAGRWRKPFNSIPCPRSHQLGKAGWGEEEKGKCGAGGRFTLLGCARLEITAGACPRQTAPGAQPGLPELCCQARVGAQYPCCCRGEPPLGDPPSAHTS